jgi:hypothetical protein
MAFLTIAFRSFKAIFGDLATRTFATRCAPSVP